jgi:hypothetical protein
MTIWTIHLLLGVLCISASSQAIIKQSNTYMRGNIKIPRIKKKYLKYLYKYETLVTFQVLPKWLDAMISGPLPLPETLSKIFNKHAVKGLQRFLLNSCNISKMPPFWITTKWWLCPTPYSPDLTLVIIFCSQEWIRIWKGGILLTLQRFNDNRWQLLTAFPVKILDNVSSSWSSTGIAASSHRGSTLNRTKFSTFMTTLHNLF